LSNFDLNRINIYFIICLYWAGQGWKAAGQAWPTVTGSHHAYIGKYMKKKWKSMNQSVT
jgi:hypothetical protein